MDLIFATSPTQTSQEIKNQLEAKGFQVKRPFRNWNFHDEDFQKQRIHWRGEMLLLKVESNSSEKMDSICFADDYRPWSGGVEWQPGVYLSRYAEGEAVIATIIWTLLLTNLKDKPSRKARFRTVVALNLK